MGKCEQCGRETTNQYNYYTADVVYTDGTYDDVVYKTRTGEYDDLRGVEKRYTVAYANFEKQIGFLCTACANKGKGPVLVVIGSIFAIMGVLSAILVIGLGANELLALSIIFLIAGIALLYYGINIKKLGKPFSDNRGSGYLLSLAGGTFFHNGLIPGADRNKKALFSLAYYNNCKKAQGGERDKSIIQHE